MTDFIAGLVVGAIFGACIGAVVMALAAGSRRSANKAESISTKEWIERR